MEDSVESCQHGSTDGGMAEGELSVAETSTSRKEQEEWQKMKKVLKKEESLRAVGTEKTTKETLEKERERNKLGSTAAVKGASLEENSWRSEEWRRKSRKICQNPVALIRRDSSNVYFHKARSTQQQRDKIEQNGPTKPDQF